ncbi:MAG: hypothetical protein HQL09_07450 [Nitrospirae bacterium]|nr:hypothetical protein [Nitrospirota bacterium]
MEEKQISNMSSEEIWFYFRKAESLEKTFKYRKILELENMERRVWKNYLL